MYVMIVEIARNLPDATMSVLISVAIALIQFA